MKIAEQVKRVVADELGINRNRILTNTDIVEDLGADPSDMKSIMRATEYKFHIKISEDNWSKMRTIDDIAHLVDVYLEIKQIEM